MAVTNTNFRIMFRNLIDLATLSSAPVEDNVASMPISNVQNLNRVESFRSTAIDATGVTITGELPSAERVSGVVISRHNLKAGDTWRFRAWSGAGKTGTEFDTGFVEALMFKRLGDLDTKVDKLVTSVFDDPGWETAFSRLFFDALIVCQSFEIQIISDGNADGYIDVNRIWLARATSLQRNFGWNYELDFVDRSIEELSEGESVRFEKHGSYRRISIGVPRILDDERSQIADVIRLALSSNEVFIDLFPGQGGKQERDYAMTCVITDRSALRSLNINKHSVDFAFKET